MSGNSSGGSSSPANTTSVNTQIVDLPTWEQQYMTSLLGQTQAVASNPYQQFPGQQVAGFTPDQTQAFSNVENLVNGNTAGQIQNAGVGSALAGANSAQNIYGSASPYLNAAAQQGSAQGVQSYMSPFLNSEIQGLQTSAQQNWNQSTAPQINDSFIGAGQFGSGRNAQVIGQQASLADQALTGQIANAANSAYGTAGTLAQNQASNLAGVGNSLGNLANTQAGTQANIGTQLGALGNQVLNTGITGATALQDVGQQQQQLNQQNINTAMTNFQNQVQYPETQLSWESNILHGLPSTTGTTGTSTGAMTNNVVGSVSPLSTLGGALIGTGGLSAANSAASSSGAVGNLARGGLIQGFKFGGQVKGYDEGGPVDSDNVDPLAALFGRSLGDQNWQAPSVPVDVDSTSGIHIDASNPALMAAATDTSARAVAPPPPPSQQQTTSAPPPANTNDYQKSANDNPLTMIKSPSIPNIDPEQMRGYQLLAMAKGLLTPAHSGAEALGNAIGDYASTGMDQAKWLAEQQQRALQFQSLNNYREGRIDLAQQKLAGQSGVEPTGQLQQIAMRFQEEARASGKDIPWGEALNKANQVLNSSANTTPVSSPPASALNSLPISGGANQPTALGGSANVDPATGDVTQPKFGFDTSNIPPKVFNQMAMEDSKQRQAALNNIPLASNILNTLDELEPNFEKVDTGGYVSQGERLAAKAFNPNGQYNTSAANIDKGTNALATDIQKFQYTPGSRGSVLGLQTILASKPSLDQPKQTNYNVTNGIRARVNDYMLTQDLAQQWRNASPLKITDSNTYAVDEALKSMYPLQSIDPKTGAVTFNKDNVQKIKDAIPDAIRNPQKYLGGAAQSGSTQKTETANQQPSQADLARAELARRAAARKQQGVQ